MIQLTAGVDPVRSHFQSWPNLNIARVEFTDETSSIKRSRHEEEKVTPPNRESSPSDSAPLSREENELVTSERLHIARGERLVKLTTWNSSLPKVGPYNVKKTSSGVRLPELKSSLYEMEDSTSLTPVARFKRYQEDGYILIRGCFDSEEGREVLRSLRSTCCKKLYEQFHLSLDENTMEEKPTTSSSSSSSSNRKVQYDINKTFKLYPHADEEEALTKSEKRWEVVRPLGIDLLNSSNLTDLVDSFVEGASEYYSQKLELSKKYSWFRLRGKLLPRKEWTEYFFFKYNELTIEDRDRWDRRYAREITRRKEKPTPRIAFQAWVSVGPNPIDGGGLALLPGSHMFTGFFQQLNVNEEVPTEFRKQAKDMPWVTADLREGDVIIMDMQTTRAFVSNKRKPSFVAAFADNMYTLQGV